MNKLGSSSLKFVLSFLLTVLLAFPEKSLFLLPFFESCSFWIRIFIILVWLFNHFFFRTAFAFIFRLNLFCSLGPTLLVHNLELMSLLCIELRNCMSTVIVTFWIFLLRILPLTYNSLITWELFRLILELSWFCKLEPESSFIVISAWIIHCFHCSLASHYIIAIEILGPFPLTLLCHSIEVIDFPIFFIIVGWPYGLLVFISHVF